MSKESNVEFVVRLLREHIAEKEKRGLVYHQCYICGKYHPADIYIPHEYIPDPQHKLNESVEHLQMRMRDYHRDREFGDNISNWLTEVFKYDGPYQTAMEEDGRHTE